MYFTFVHASCANDAITGDVNDPFEPYPDSNIIRARTVRDTAIFTSGDFTERKTGSYMYARGGSWDICDNLTVKSVVVYQQTDFGTDSLAMSGEGRQPDRH